MALPTSPPRYPSYKAMLAAISRASSPSEWATYSLQRAIGVIPATGHFGDVTHRKLKEWQRDHGLLSDGIAGPATQAAILVDAGRRADRAHGLPDGVGFGFATAEGGGILAATNWSVSGGVDCGPAQWRVSGPPFSQTALIRAFRPYQALDHACLRLRNAQLDFLDRNHHWEDPQEALNVAVLQHNWPSGADQIVRRYPGGGKWWRYVSNPDDPATWVDGFTRAEWCREYPSRVLKFVV